jgi:hypothetical protein
VNDVRDKLHDTAGERRHIPRRVEDMHEGRSKPTPVPGGRHLASPHHDRDDRRHLVAMIPLLMILDQQGKIRRQQNQIAGLVTQVQLSRRTTTVAFCRSINKNALASNRTTDVITSFVLDSTRASKAFERVYRQLGLPPYKVRLQQSKRLAHDLVKQKLPVIDCDKIARDIDRQLARAGQSHPSIPKDTHLRDYPG